MTSITNSQMVSGFVEPRNTSPSFQLFRILVITPQNIAQWHQAVQYTETYTQPAVISLQTLKHKESVFQLNRY
jgi:hypothetical protein